VIGGGGASSVLPPTPTAVPRLVSLIPRNTFIGLSDRAAVTFSRDGTQLSWLAPYKNALNVWVAPADNVNDAKPVTDTGRGTRSYTWAYTNQHVLYLQDDYGDENYQIYSVDITTGQTKQLTTNKNARAGIQRVSPKFPREVLITLNERDAKQFDLYRLNIDTGARQLVLQNDGFNSFITDDDYTVRFAIKVTPDGGRDIMRRNASGAWESFIKIGRADESTTYPISLDQSGKILRMVDSRGRNTGALVELNLETGEQKVIAEDSRADLSNTITHPTTRVIQAVAFAYERQQWRVLDQSIAPDMAYLRTVADGEFDVTARSLDDRFWIVAYDFDNGPRRYYLYNHAIRRAQFLFSSRQALEGLPFARMNPVLIKSRDGLELVSYLTLPRNFERSDNAARPVRPMPMVLLVHGGPWARDSWGYDPDHQWLANRGYAVLSVNYRGSTGFGKAFLNAGDREWAGKMHDDLIDAVNWAIQERVADAKKICIMGGSYGGYAALVGLTFTPEVFACGVDIFGPSNLVTLMQNPPPYWSTSADIRKQRVGDHTTEAGRAFLLQRSPLTFVDRITKPLLIEQGGNDPRVKPAESEQIVKAMQAKGLPVTYVYFPREGHGFQNVWSSRAFNAVVEAFLSVHLGGRYEPIDNEFQAALVEVRAGAELVPGVKEALR
jgi:dipeptidyl aminopeptidase/acylaminoacyl peptidase